MYTKEQRSTGRVHRFVQLFQQHQKKKEVAAENNRLE